jgi:AcrR family transcriptional regulator
VSRAGLTDASGEPLGRREAGKTERRRRIIEAARALIRETGDAGLSMRALAARAGVSLATPYNLFGSKRAIVLAVLEDVREYRERFAALRATDPIERIFQALHLALDYYKRDRRFYKTLWAAIFDTTDEVRTAILNPQRTQFWRELVGEAKEAGAIAGDIDVDLLLDQLEYTLRSAMWAWVVGELDQKRLTPTAYYGFALVLAGAASPGWRAPLQARVRDSQTKLRAITRKKS